MISMPLREAARNSVPLRRGRREKPKLGLLCGRLAYLAALSCPNGRAPDSLRDAGRGWCSSAVLLEAKP